MDYYYWQIFLFWTFNLGMRISSINTYYPQMHRSPVVQNVQSPSFTHHKDYDELCYRHGIDPLGRYIVNSSSYFRRGHYYGKPIDSYKDVIDTFEDVFKDKKYPKKMLVVGVADSQEPFSYLASIKEIVGRKPLKKVLDLHIVDLKSKPSRFDNDCSAYFDNPYPPIYAQSSFVLERNSNMYKVNNEIFKYLTSTYDNKQKSQWETRIQDASLQYPSESFDIISIHNVLPYIKNKEGQNSVDLTLENLYRSLKPGGVLIADPYFKNYSVSSLTFDKMEEIHDGIYKK